MPDIFLYTDFRLYLRACFKEIKRVNQAFSHRFLSQKLGLFSPSLMLLVIQGKRNLTPTIRHKLSEYLNHTKKEFRYFEHMVAFLQSKTHEERDTHYSAMLELRRPLKIAMVDARQYEYYSNWFNPVIRELSAGPGFSIDFKTLAKSLSPPITPEQARRSIELLLELGLIKKNGGGFVQTDQLITTGPVVDSVAVANFHRKTALLAAESFNRHTRQERTITSCTVTLSESHFQMLKQEIADLRKRALELAGEPVDSNRVYQLNVQLFPVSKIIKKDGSP